jgi:pyridoxamine 5'-phosphate oxidase
VKPIGHALRAGRDPDRIPAAAAAVAGTRAGQPEAGAAQAAQPEAGAAQPEAGAAQPEAGAAQPEAGAAQPEAGAAQAGLPGTLTEAMLPADPMDLLRAWMDDVARAGLPEPTAMALATVSADLRPRARMVLLKAFDADGFTFYTNRTSRKGSDLAEVPRACLLFPWQALHRQVIIEGPVTALSVSASEPYFHSRPHGSQLGAWASRQSSVLASRAELDDRYQELEHRWPEGTEVPMPDFWGGYRVRPETMEFWQGQPSRLHDRFRYTADGQSWTVCRLAP